MGGPTQNRSKPTPVVVRADQAGRRRKAGPGALVDGTGLPVRMPVTRTLADWRSTSTADLESVSDRVADFMQENHNRVPVGHQEGLR